MTEAGTAKKRALAAHQAGRVSDALPLYEAHLKAEPQDSEGWRLYGIALLHAHKGQDALRALGRAVALNGNDAEALYALGAAFQNAGKSGEALARYEAALIVKPDHAGALNGMGSVWQSMGKRDLAERSFRRALARQPDHGDATLNLGSLMLEDDRAEEALPLLEDAAKDGGNRPLACLRLGRAYRMIGDEEAALAAFEKALSVRPDDAVTRYDRALSLLALDRFAEGFDALESRTDRSDMRPWPKTLPVWDGGDVAGKRVYVFAEQGQGDQIQFVRYVPLLADRGARITLEVHPRLMPVMQTLGGVDTFAPYGASTDGHDLLAPLLSLPRHLGADPRDIQAAPYLSAPDGSNPLHEAQENGATRVGLFWSGNPQQPTNPRRSIPLDALQPLLDSADAEFFSLQKGSAATDLHLTGNERRVTDLGPQLADFGATARVLNSLDLLITTDTAIAHMAGAMGRPAWVMLAYSADWRWGKGDRTLWYPSLRLFRQRAPGDWASVTRALIERLSEERETLQSGR